MYKEITIHDKNNNINKQVTSFYNGPLLNHQQGFISETFTNTIPKIDISNNIKIGILKDIFGFSTFNHIQSQLIDTCVNQTSNMVVSAPTGMGKSEIALLCVLKSLLKSIKFISNEFRITDQEISNKNHSIIYLVPMRALASQTVEYLKQRLHNLHTIQKKNNREKHQKMHTEITIAEYTSDISYAPNATILVCTPEKFEFLIKKNPNKAQTIQLVVFDEIHILGTSRGVCIERLMFPLLKNPKIRIIGLSATISNLEDLSTFIKGEKYDFKSKDIPVDLSYLSIENKAQSDQTICNLLYQYQRQGVSILMFVNRRKETERIAKMFLTFLEINDLELPFPDPLLTRNEEKLLYNFYNKGVGIHHSRLSKIQRSTTEALFKSGRINLLISTSTLAWGINLPAQIVILCGLDYFNSKGRRCDYDIKDVLQCVGRTGRRGHAKQSMFKNSYLELGNQFSNSLNKKPKKDNRNNKKNTKLTTNTYIKDSTAHAFIIGSDKQLNKYKPTNFNNILLESHLLTELADSILSFISIDTTFTHLKDFFDSTYLRIRMLKKPELYGITKVEGCYENIYDVFHEYLMMSCRKLERNFCIAIKTSYRINDIAPIHEGPRSVDGNHMELMESYSRTKFGEIACLYAINHATMGNLVKIQNRNKNVFQCPISFIVFLLQNHEFASMENIKINERVMRTYHQFIMALPPHIQIEESWDVCLKDNLEKYRAMDLLENSKYSSKIEKSDTEYSQLFLRLIVIFELVDSIHKNRRRYGNDLSIFVDFMDKTFGRIVSGLVELECFRQPGVLFLDALLDGKMNQFNQYMLNCGKDIAGIGIENVLCMDFSEEKNSWQ